MVNVIDLNQKWHQFKQRHNDIFTATFTTRIPMGCGKVIFLHLCVRAQGDGVPQSQILSQISRSRSFPGGTTAPAGTGVAPPPQGLQ